MNQVVLSEPIERPISKVVSFQIRVMDLVLGTSARLGIYLECLTGEQRTREYRELVLEGDEYLAWGTDDTYLLTIVESKIPTLL